MYIRASSAHGLDNSDITGILIQWKYINSASWPISIFSLPSHTLGTGSCHNDDQYLKGHAERSTFEMNSVKWQGLMAAYDGAGTGQVGQKIVSCGAEPGWMLG